MKQHFFIILFVLVGYILFHFIKGLVVGKKMIREYQIDQQNYPSTAMLKGK